MKSRQVALGVGLSALRWQDLRTCAEQLDLERGGHYDVRAGCINLWCSPQDKPACWGAEVSQGALPHPRDFVASLFYEPLQGYGYEKGMLYLELDPEISRHAMRRVAPDKYELCQAAWADIERWSRFKVEQILNFAQLRLTTECYGCPWCAFSITPDQDFVALIDHVRIEHQQNVVHAVCVGHKITLQMPDGEIEIPQRRKDRDEQPNL